MGLSILIDKILYNVKNKIDRRLGEFNKSKLASRSSVSIGEGFVFNFQKSSFEVNGNPKVVLGKDVRFRDFCSVMIYDGANLTLEESVHFNRYCSINCLGFIHIGAYTIFGEGVKIYDHNHKYEDINAIIQKETCKVGKISIGSNCWIGSNVTILNNVSIGDNVVIGANNLIYKDVPSNTIVKSRVESIVQDRR